MRLSPTSVLVATIFALAATVSLAAAQSLGGPAAGAPMQIPAPSPLLNYPAPQQATVTQTMPTPSTDTHPTPAPSAPIAPLPGATP